MPENPARFLDRTEARRHAAEHFSPQIALLRNLADYGSNLVIRAFNSSERNTAAVISCGVLLKQIVAMVDAAYVLVEAGTVHAAYLPARTTFEASVYLDWIPFGDTERKARCYLVSNYRDQRLWALRVVKGTDEETVFNAIAKSIGLDIHARRPTLANDAKTQLAEIDRILGQPELAGINKEFDKMRGKRKFDPNWYELSGLTSFRQVAKAVGRLVEYEFFYSKGSQVTHTASYKDHLSFRQKQIQFKQIRNLEGINNLLNFLVGAVVQSYQHTIMLYRLGELPAFQRKYIEEWRHPFLTVQGVTYKEKNKA